MYWLIPLLTVNLLRVTVKATGKKFQPSFSLLVGSLLITFVALSLILTS